MKQIIGSIATFGIIALTLFNCQKETNSSVISKEDNFNKILETKLNSLETEVDALVMYKEAGEYKITFEKDLLNFYFDSPSAANTRARMADCGKPVGTEVCSGNGLTIAKCSQDYIEKGCALVVWKDSNGNYHAKIAQL